MPHSEYDSLFEKRAKQMKGEAGKSNKLKSLKRKKSALLRRGK